MRVKEGNPLFEIIRIQPIRIVFALPHEHVGVTAALDRVVATFPPLESVTIPIDQIRVDPETSNDGSLRVTALIPNNGLIFRSGLSGTVSLTTTKKLQVLKVPEATILEQGGKNYVFRVVDEIAHKIEIETGETKAGLTEVIRGLAIDDQIVVNGLKGLKDGAFVQIQ